MTDRPDNDDPRWVIPDGLPASLLILAATGEAGRALWPHPQWRAEQRLLHRSRPSQTGGAGYCDLDLQSWPCPVIRLLDVLDAMEPAAHIVAGHRDMLAGALVVARTALLPSRPAVAACPRCTDWDRVCENHRQARIAAANYAHLEQALTGVTPHGVPPDPDAAWLAAHRADVTLALTVASNVLDHAVEACTVCVSLDEPCANHRADRAVARRFRDARRVLPA